MSGYSNIIRKIKETYPNLKFKIQKSIKNDDCIDIIFIDLKESLEISNHLTWDNTKNIIKGIIECKNSNICNICFEDNNKNWKNMSCPTCSINYCGLCHVKSIKINKKNFSCCPFCKRKNEDINIPIESLYYSSYVYLCKNQVNMKTIMKDFYAD